MKRSRLQSQTIFRNISSQLQVQDCFSKFKLLRYFEQCIAHDYGPRRRAHDPYPHYLSTNQLGSQYEGSNYNYKQCKQGRENGLLNSINKKEASECQGQQRYFQQATRLYGLGFLWYNQRVESQFGSKQQANQGFERGVYNSINNTQQACFSSGRGKLQDNPIFSDSGSKISKPSKSVKRSTDNLDQKSQKESQQRKPKGYQHKTSKSTQTLKTNNLSDEKEQLEVDQHMSAIANEVRRMDTLSHEQDKVKAYFKEMENWPEELVREVVHNMTGSKLFGKMPVREVKGVGQKNELILQEAGCAYLWQLLFLFQYRYASDELQMNEYLKEIGIKKHRKIIIEFLKSDNILVRNSVLTLEGNIGAGKTTFLNSLSPYTQKKIKVFEEPIQQWQNVKYTVKTRDSSTPTFNLLKHFYENPQQAFHFQTFVLGTKLGQSGYTSDPFHYDQISPLGHTPHSLDMVHLLERSVFADRLVFVKSLHKSGQMNDEEVSIYDSWFDRLVNWQFTSLVPDGFVYLRVEPKVCQKRMQIRNRSEEVGVGLDYLVGLHDMHEEWLRKDSMQSLDDKSIKQLLLARRQARYVLLKEYVQAESCIRGKEQVSIQNIRRLLFNALDINQIPRIPQIPKCLSDSDMVKLQFIDPGRNRQLSKYLGLGAIPILEIDWNEDWDTDTDSSQQKKVAVLVESFVDWVSKFKPLIRIPELLPVQFMTNH